VAGNLVVASLVVKEFLIKESAFATWSPSWPSCAWTGSAIGAWTPSTSLWSTSCTRSG